MTRHCRPEVVPRRFAAVFEPTSAFVEAPQCAPRWLGDASADAVADRGLGCLAMHLWPVAVAIDGAVVVRFA